LRLPAATIAVFAILAGLYCSAHPVYDLTCPQKLLQREVE